MKCLSRNKQTFYYALYESDTPIIDEYGNDTGETEVIYGKPIKYAANISSNKGETETRLFGDDLGYDKTIALDNNAPPIDEFSVLWVDTVPALNEDGSLAADDAGTIITPYDYIVKNPAKSLNGVVLAISKVLVGG